MITCNHQAELCLYLKISILILTSTLFNTGILTGQDLILRTLSNSPLKSTTAPNRIAKELASVGEFNKTNLFSFKTESDIESSITKDLINSVELTLDHDLLQGIAQNLSQNMSLDIPVDAKNQFTLLVRPVEILSPEFKLSSSKGLIEQHENSRPRFYRGIVSDDGNSMVSIVVHNGKINISIHDAWGNYQISRLPGHQNQYVLFNATLNPEYLKPACLTDDIRHSIRKKVTSSIPNDYQKSVTCIPLYIETDKFTYDSFNSDITEVQNYVVTLIGDVATIYSNEQVSIALSQLHVVTEAVDDWSAPINDLSTLIETFAETTQNNYNGRLAHFITRRNLGGGLGWIGVLCSNYGTFWADWDGDGEDEEHHYGPYAVSTNMNGVNVPFPAYSFDVGIFTHEMGHNIGSPHTHACAWGASNLAIDNCVATEGGCVLLVDPPDEGDLGTIMSYCHLTQTGIDFTKGFGSLPGQLLRDNVNSASCVLDCSGGSELGCTDPSFHNYDPNATIDDGSCSGTCSDGIKNGDETGLDCGGSLCQSCMETCALNYIRLTLNFDNHPQETHWAITLTSTSTVVESGGPYTEEPDGSQLIIDMCLPDDNYTFTIYDNWGDGMCCSSGNGSYLLIGNSNDTLASGGQFESSEITDFILPVVSCSSMLVVSGVPTNGSFMATDSIMTQGDVMVSSNALFSSPSIDIYGGFSVSEGASFEIYQDGCPN